MKNTHKRNRISIAMAAIVIVSLCAVSASPLGVRAAGGSSANVQAPSQVGAPIQSAPAVCARNASSLDLFAKGTGGALWWKHWNGQTWSSSTSLGGPVTSDPAAVLRGAEIDVFVRGADGALWTRSTTNGGTSWSNWYKIGGQLLSGTSPAAYAWGDARIGWFVTGTNKALYHMWKDSAGTHSWENLGGVLTSSPAATSPTSGVIDVFVRGGDGALYQREYNNEWQSWKSLGGQIASGTGPAACSGFSAGRLDVFVKGMNGALYHRGYYAAWSSWENLGGSLSASPAAVAPALVSSTPQTTNFGSVPLNYTRYGNGPILTLPTAANELSELSVINAKELISNPIDNYYLYTAPHNAPGGVYLYTAPSPVGPWTLYSQTPVIQKSILNNSNVSHVSSPWVVWNDDAHVFYCYFHAATPIQRTFLATSKDGISWTLYGTTPVLDVGRAGTWDSLFAAYATVAKVGSNWYMWYEGMIGSASNVEIGFATSTNGTTWTKYSDNPVLSADPSVGELESPGAMTSSVYYNSDNGGTFYLLYGLGELGNRTTNIAQTKDGHTITRYTNNPILAPSANGWDSTCAAGGVLFYDSGTYYLFYLGGSGTGSSNIYVGLASNPPKAVARGIAHEIYVFVRGNDGALWQKTYVAGTTQWSGWTSIGGM